jgi:hypothetical protein
MQSEKWREFWDYFELRCLTFKDVGLDLAVTDKVVWDKCQELPAFLLTNNRNDDGPESLQATIQITNSPKSLPVFTIGDADSILSSTEYADKVIERLFVYLFDIDNILGTGRLFLR